MIKKISVELLQGRKRNLSLELGSIPMATRKSEGFTAKKQGEDD